MDNFERLFNEQRKFLNVNHKKSSSASLPLFDLAFMYSIKANVKDSNGNYTGAISDYKKSLWFSTYDSYVTYHQIGRNYLMLEQFDKALVAFDVSIELKENLQSSGVDESVIPYSASGVALKVSGESMYSNRARVKLILGNDQGCLDDCNKAIELNPYYSSSYFIVGLLFIHAGYQEEAYQALNQADSLGHPQALSVIQRLISDRTRYQRSSILVRED